MTTTACDDQFGAEPEPVHHPYDVAAILRKNIADLEKELQRQREQNAAATERLREQIERVTSEWERAENDAAAARSDLQSFIDSRNELMAKLREVLRECADDLAIELDQRYGDSRKYPSEQRKYEAEMQPVYRARSLLQSAPQPTIGDK